MTKGGGRDFHGSGYWFYRDKGMNANDWLSNRDGQPKPLYHFNYLGYTVGGPIYLPGRFNTAKDRLFFFWSKEYQRQLTPRDQNGRTRSTTTLPTALERQGDFSQSVDSSGNPFPYVRDYTTNLPCHGPTTNPPGPADTRGCFADGGLVLGKIPANRLYGPGIKLLNLFPLPKDAGPKGFVNNYIYQPSGSVPRHEQVLRIDYNLSPKWRLYGSLINLAEDVVSINASASGYSFSPNFPITPADFYHPGYLFNLNATTVLSSNMTNEAQFGVNHHPVTVLPHDPQAISAGATGINLPALFTGFAGWIPDFNFGGSRISNSPQLRYSGAGGSYTPFLSHNAVIDAVDNLTIVRGKHVIKTGIYMHRNRKDQTAFVPTEGVYNWGDSSSNPLDTGLGFANAAIGVFTSFQQATRPANGEYRFTNLEFYGQDSWKVTPRFTLNYGVRAYWIQPEFDQLLQTSNFLASSWKANQAPRLYWPSCANPQCTAKVGIDRADLGGTGQTTSAVNIGAIVPNSGNLTNGILLAGKDLSKYLIRSPGILLGPRLGLAYDLTGRGNLVFRAGGGVYFDRPCGNTIFDLLANPPTIFTPTVFNGLAQNISLNNPSLFPSGITGISYNGNFPTTYNYSAGIQARLPYAMVLDAAYVGSVSRHLQDDLPLNPVPYGADFLQQNQDPTKGSVTPPFTGSRAYDANFLRPFPGYGGVNLHQFDGTSNYNSLQVKLDRRFARGLFLGVAYTWSKCMEVGDNEGSSHRIDGFNRLANYGPCGFDIRQNLIFNYVYALPGASSLGSLNNRATRAAFNGWQLSGTTQFRTSTPFTPNFSVPGVSNSTNLTGSPDFSARMKLIGDPYQGTTDSPYNRLNAAAFAPASVGSIGLESSRNFLNNPGVNDWDMSLQRNVRLTERAHLEFRLDAFNVFNHTQFSGINSGINFSSLTNPVPTNLPFDSNGNLVNKNGFGTVNSVRSARVLQTVVRLVF